MEITLCVLQGDVFRCPALIHVQKKKDGPGPVVVSNTLCPAVHISGCVCVNVYNVYDTGPRPSFSEFMPIPGTTQ